eukprot:7927342-Heterocapsa_arctica.AAC.1
MDVAEFTNDLTARVEVTIAGIRSSRPCMGMHPHESDGRLVSSMRLLRPLHLHCSYADAIAGTLFSRR